MTTMTGERRYPDASGRLWLPPCSYGKDTDGVWNIRGPQGGSGILDGHTVIEHEDGTITVSPSLDFPGVWHGWLERGVFRNA